MKATTLLFLICLCGLSLPAQTPQAIKYQAVARNSSGEILVNQKVSFRINVSRRIVNGIIVYAELHSKTTNNYGLVDLEIGKGTPVTGIFSTIDWGADDYFLWVEMDPAGGSNYQDMGKTQLLSVPYALYAKDVKNKDDADADPANELQKIILSGTVLTLDKSGGSVTLPSSGSGGDNWGTDYVHADATLTGQGTTASPLKIADNGVSSAKILDGTIVSSDLADNAVTTAKIQDGTIVTADLANLSVTTDKLSNLAVSTEKIQNGMVTSDKLANNAVTTDKINAGAVTGAKIAQSGATTGQALKWSGITWAPADDATGAGGLSLPWAGSTSTGDPGSYAFTVNSLVQNATAICGKNTSAGSSEGDGVYGESSSIIGSGVYGVSKSGGAGVKGKGSTGVYADGNAYGVYARGSIAVEGLSSSSTGYGIYGYTSDETGTTYGVYGKSMSVQGYGVYGVATAPGNSKSGVYGEGSNGSGVSGKVLYEGSGVYGLGASTTATNRGVTGLSNSQYGGIGVEGRAEASAGATIGVKGLTKSPSGYGVYGEGAIASGTNYGVYGISYSAAGYGIYGQAPRYGVYGKSTEFQGSAVTGEATGTSSVGVQGTATNSNSTGVWGEGDNQGVYGVSALATGKGVYGAATSSTGANFGIYGESASAAGYGVYGKAPLYGVYGISSASNSYGVYGTSSASSGTGVYGISTAAAGYGLYGESPQFGAYVKSTGNTGRAIKAEATGTGSIGVWGIGLSASSTGVYGQGANYDFYAAGPGVDYGTGSSIRWKRNIELISDPLDKIMALRGVCFDWDDEHSGKHDVGMIAEEVGQVLPEIVVYEENGTDALGMDYSKITPLLVEALKALKTENDILRNRLEKLEKLIGASAEK